MAEFRWFFSALFDEMFCENKKKKIQVQGDEKKISEETFVPALTQQPALCWTRLEKIYAENVKLRELKFRAHLRSRGPWTIIVRNKLR